MNVPNPKYVNKCYRFGEVMSSHWVDNDPLDEPYWQYRVLKRGNKHPFFYAEEEVEAMDRAANVTTVI